MYLNKNKAVSVDMSSRMCKGQILSSKLVGSEMLYGLLDWFDSCVIRDVMAPPKDRYHLTKEASLSPSTVQRAGKILHNAVKSNHLTTIEKQPLLSSLGKKNTLQSLRNG